MKKTVWVLVLSLLVSACGREASLEEKQTFEPYLSRWDQVADGHGRGFRDEKKEVRVIFGNLKGRQGTCEEGLFKTPTVVMDRRTWEGRTDLGREMMLFHELGHCLLDRDHRDDTAVVADARGTIPASIMHTRGVDPVVYAQYRDYYLKELFSQQ